MSRRQSWQPTAISSYLRTEARFRTMKLRIRRPGESILGKQTLKTIQNGYNDGQLYKRNHSGPYMNSKFRTKLPELMIA